MLRQVPPGLRSSTITVSRPSWPARIARDIAAGAGADHQELAGNVGHGRSSTKIIAGVSRSALMRWTKTGGVPAVDHPVVEAGGQVHAPARHEAGAVPDRAHLDLVDPDDGDFRMVDDRRRDDAAHRAKRRDGDGRAGQLLALGRAGLRRLAEPGHFAAQFQTSRASAWRTTGTTSPAPVWAAIPIWTPPCWCRTFGLVVIEGVQRRLLADGDDHGPHQEWQEGQLSAASVAPVAVHRGAQFLERLDVDLLDIGDVGDAALGRAPSSRRCAA